MMRYDTSSAELRLKRCSANQKQLLTARPYMLSRRNEHQLTRFSHAAKPFAHPPGPIRVHLSP